jgi:nucleoside diphosphate kinase
MITTLVSGPLLALAVVGGTDTVEQLRELCGPVDPEVAKALRPGTYSDTL